MKTGSILSRRLSRATQRAGALNSLRWKRRLRQNVAAAKLRVEELRKHVELASLKREVRLLGAAALASSPSTPSDEDTRRRRERHALLCRFYSASLRFAPYSERMSDALKRGLDRLLRLPSAQASKDALITVKQSATLPPPDVTSLCSSWRKRHAVQLAPSSSARAIAVDTLPTFRILPNALASASNGWD